MMLSKAELAKRLSGSPLLMDPSEAAFLSALGDFLGDMGEADQAWAFDSTADRGNGKPYRVEDGLAVIPVHGMLLHKYDLHIEGWLTGYDYIGALAEKAAADPAVRALVLDVASHGGEVNGCFDCAALLADIGKRKPVYAVVDGYAHSAGYALASKAGKLFMSETASVGSVGVITMHVDYSKALSEAGIKVTMIYAGDHKADGNPFEPLKPEVKKRIGERVEKSYTVFVGHVAEGRGLDPEAVRGTKAGCFSGPDAVAIGFADAVMSPREAFAALKAAPAGAVGNINLKVGVSAMSGDNQEQQAEQAVDVKAVQQEAAAAERERISAIVGCEEAKGRESLASHFAFNTAMSAEEAVKALAAAPKAEPKAEKADAGGIKALDDAMKATGGSPEVGADGGKAPVEEAQDPAAKILADYNAARGVTATKH